MLHASWYHDNRLSCAHVVKCQGLHWFLRCCTYVVCSCRVWVCVVQPMMAACRSSWYNVALVHPNVVSNTQSSLLMVTVVVVWWCNLAYRFAPKISTYMHPIYHLIRQHSIKRAMICPTIHFTLWRASKVCACVRVGVCVYVGGWVRCFHFVSLSTCNPFFLSFVPPRKANP